MEMYFHLLLHHNLLLFQIKYHRVPAHTFGGDANPVQVPGELLGDVGLPSSRKSHHDDHRWRVGELGH